MIGCKDLAERLDLLTSRISLSHKDLSEYARYVSQVASELRRLEGFTDCSSIAQLVLDLENAVSSNNVPAFISRLEALEALSRRLSRALAVRGSLLLVNIMASLALLIVSLSITLNPSSLPELELAPLSAGLSLAGALLSATLAAPLLLAVSSISLLLLTPSSSVAALSFMTLATSIAVIAIRLLVRRSSVLRGQGLA